MEVFDFETSKLYVENLLVPEVYTVFLTTWLDTEELSLVESLVPSAYCVESGSSPNTTILPDPLIHSSVFGGAYMFYSWLDRNCLDPNS